MERNIERGQELLQRIIALLFSLADAAEHAAGRSRRVRRPVLAILRPAEAAAFRSVASAARHFGAPIPATAIVASGGWIDDDDDDPDDALRLAERFRALALALSYISAWADYFARRLTALGHTQRRSWQDSPVRLAERHGAAGDLNDLASRIRAPP